MEPLRSKYKIFGGFGLMVGLMILVQFMAYEVLIKPNISLGIVELISDENIGLAHAVIFAAQLGMFILFNTQCKSIRIYKTHVVYIYPLLPLIKKTRYWAEYDYAITVEEHSSEGSYEAVWLISNNKIKDRFSSFYYSNYQQLKDQVNIKYEDSLLIPPFKQLYCLLGGRVR